MTRKAVQSSHKIFLSSSQLPPRSFRPFCGNAPKGRIVSTARRWVGMAKEGSACWKLFKYENVLLILVFKTRHNDREGILHRRMVGGKLD
jgi:hypothetical protein